MQDIHSHIGQNQTTLNQSMSQKQNHWEVKKIPEMNESKKLNRCVRCQLSIALIYGVLKDKDRKSNRN